MSASNLYSCDFVETALTDDLALDSVRETLTGQQDATWFVA